jgi:hypothetical protein
VAGLVPQAIEEGQAQYFANDRLRKMAGLRPKLNATGISAVAGIHQQRRVDGSEIKRNSKLSLEVAVMSSDLALVTGASG